MRGDSYSDVEGRLWPVGGNQDRSRLLPSPPEPPAAFPPRSRCPFCWMPGYIRKHVSVVVACAACAGVSCSGLSVSIVSIESRMTESLAFLYVTKLHQKFSWPAMVVICYVASTAVALMTVPLIEFLWALFTFFAYSAKLNEQMRGLLWPLLVLGFIATIFFAFDCYPIFNDLTKFLEKGEPTGETEAQKSSDEELDSDSD